MSDNYGVKRDCYAWCPLLGVTSLLGNGVLVCRETKGHSGPHRLVLNTSEPMFRFTVEWEALQGDTA